MRFVLLNIIGIVLISHVLLMGQDFSGQFYVESANGEVVLTLKPDSEGGYQGQLTDNNNVFILHGTVHNGLLKGTVGDEGIFFQAQLSDGYLIITMNEIDELGDPVPETMQTLTFRRQIDEQIPTSDWKKLDGEEIIINDVVLSKDQIAELSETYGVSPKPGKYWYDSLSGLYGVVGYPAYGFMLPGHTFGDLGRTASNGNTGVIVNNRELPQSEWAVWSYMIGYWIQPGSYWLDHNGNSGYEGNPNPVINLYLAAQQNAYRGQGSSGDNFWSTRFSAGNYDSGNQRGYVSVPGYGPVGYGF